MSAPAPLARATAAQMVMELRLTARRGENLLAMLGIPVGVLVVFGSVAVLPAPVSGVGRVDSILPGTLALAIIATGLVNLGIATAYERSYGVLKRLGGSPLGRSGLVGAKIASVLVIELVLLVLLTLVAVGLLGWRPSGPPDPGSLVAGVALGTAAFAGLGLAMAGALRAEATLLLANVLFLLVLAIGGVLVPVADLPEPLRGLVGLSPSSALTEALRIGLGAEITAGGSGATVAAAMAASELARHLVVLAAWAVVTVGAAVRTFRWD